MKKKYSCYIFILGFLMLFTGCSKTMDLLTLETPDVMMNTSKNSLSNFDSYYWYNNKKVGMNKNTNKKYILFTSANEVALNMSVQQKAVNVIKSAEKLILSSAIQKNEKRIDADMKWAVVENSVSLASNDFILYEAPFFKLETGEEAGLSHLFYVKLKHENGIANLLKLASQYNVEIVGNNKYMPLWFTLACSKESKGNALEAANTFFESGLFAASQPDLMVEDKLNCSNDALFNDQWNLNNTGQFGGTYGIDIKYCSAKSISQGSNSVIVAIIDQGIELSHPDLNIYNMSYDTETGTSPSILHGNHGTACAGISGAITDNNIGISGIAPNCPLMSISNSLAPTPDSRQKRADGINFAWSNGASVLSNSWSSSVMYSIIDDAISLALSSGRGGLGSVVVFSAGNENNSTVSYPARSNPEILAVGAMSYCGERKNPSSCDGEIWGSNYGSALDIVAPGVRISTTDLTGGAGYVSGNYFSMFNGTSAAAPHVAATAALILSVNPSLTQQQVANIIEQTGQKVGSYFYTNQTGRPNGTWNNEMGYGLLNTFAALTAASCNTVYFNNQNVTTNTTVSGCTVEAEYITVSGGASLTFAGSQTVIIKRDFIINAGSNFYMTN